MQSFHFYYYDFMTFSMLYDFIIVKLFVKEF